MARKTTVSTKKPSKSPKTCLGCFLCKGGVLAPRRTVQHLVEALVQALGQLSYMFG